MFRALFELIVMFLIAMAARAILASVMKNFQNAARTGFQGSTPPQPPAEQPKPKEKTAGELHKDPVCGMYVAESTQYQRHQGREIVYYCSEECKDKDKMASRA